VYVGYLAVLISMTTYEKSFEKNVALCGRSRRLKNPVIPTVIIYLSVHMILVHGGDPTGNRTNETNFCTVLFLILHTSFVAECSPINTDGGVRLATPYPDFENSAKYLRAAPHLRRAASQPLTCTG
jgi:hypothetical protein